MKLTNPQLETLIEVERGGDIGLHCVPQYKPAQRLVALGLAKWRGDRDYLILTDAGRLSLQQAEASK